MRWGIRSQVLLTLSAVLAFGLLASYVVTSRVTRATVLDAQVDQSRRLVELVSVHLEASTDQQSLDEALVRLRQRVVPNHLFLLGQHLRPVEDTPEMRLLFSRHVQAEDLVPYHARELRHGVLVDRSERPLLVVMAPLMTPLVTADVAVSVICLLVPLEGTMTRLEHITALYLLFALVILVMAVLLGYVFLGRTVVQPLHRLVRVVERIRGGQFRGDTEEGTGSTREMDQIFGSVERMTEQLESDRKSIRRHVSELEFANREIASAQERLVRTEKLASVGELAAGIAHEIGNPIATVQGYLDMLEEDQLEDEERQKVVGVMQQAIRRVATIIRDLLDFARPSGDPASTADVSEAVAAAVKLIGPQKRFRGIELKMELPSEPLLVTLAAGRLEQVVLNLLFNAADASGGEGEVRVRVYEREEGICVEVSDDGEGMDADRQARIFDPFFSSKEPGEGTGLGLAVCHGIIEDAGGKIEVVSAPGLGATFSVVMPAYKDPEADEEVSDAVSPDPGP